MLALVRRLEAELAVATALPEGGAGVAPGGGLSPEERAVLEAELSAQGTVIEELRRRLAEIEEAQAAEDEETGGAGAVPTAGTDAGAGAGAAFGQAYADAAAKALAAAAENGTFARPGPGVFTRSSRKFLPKSFPRAAAATPAAAEGGFVRPGPGSFVLARRQFASKAEARGTSGKGVPGGFTRPKPGTFRLPKRSFREKPQGGAGGSHGVATATATATAVATATTAATAAVATAAAAVSGFVRPPRVSFRLPERDFLARSSRAAGSDPASPPGRTAFERPPPGSFGLTRRLF